MGRVQVIEAPTQRCMRYWMGCPRAARNLLSGYPLCWVHSDEAMEMLSKEVPWAEGRRGLALYYTDTKKLRRKMPDVLYVEG